METRCLCDKDIYPADDVVAHFLGRAKPAWDAFGDMVKNDYPSLTAEWRYYNDGKSWLCKVTQKKKTFCWISVHENHFKTTFYFGDKADDVIMHSAVGDEVKAQWRDNKKIGAIKPITLTIKKKADVKSIQSLIEIKALIK